MQIIIQLIEYFENIGYRYSCDYCNAEIDVVKGLKYKNNFCCKNCTRKQLDEKKLNKNDFVDPIYQCYKRDGYDNLIRCKRCSKYKRIASFMSSAGERIQINTYCKSCSLKKTI